MAVAVEALPALLVLCMFVSLLLLNASYRVTFGYLLGKLADVFHGFSVGIPHIGRIGFGSIGDVIDTVNNSILLAFAEGIQATSWAWKQCLHWMAYTVQEMAAATAYVADEARMALHVMRHHLIPTLIAAGLGPLAAIVYATQKLVGALSRDVPKVAHQAAVTATDVTHAARVRVTRITKYVYVTVPAAVTRAIAVPIPRLGQLEREASQAEKWIRAHGKQLTVAGITGLTVAALGRLGLGWTRCSKVGRVGKALCGMDESIIEDALTGLLVIGSTISIVELARECQSFTATADGALRAFVRELS